MKNNSHKKMNSNNMKSAKINSNNSHNNKKFVSVTPKKANKVENTNEIKKIKEPLESVRIKKVGILSLANTLAVVNFIIGLIFAIVAGILMLLGKEITTPSGNFLGTFGTSNIIVVLAIPLVLGVVGWIQGIIIGIFYNLASKISKGIKLYA